MSCFPHSSTGLIAVVRHPFVIRFAARTHGTSEMDNDSACTVHLCIYSIISFSLIYLHVFTRIENELLFEVAVGTIFLGYERLL